MIREDAAYIAGLFEGEGCVRNARRRSKVDGRWLGPYPEARIVMTDLEPVQRAQWLLGFGAIYGPYARSNPAYKDTWTLQIYGFEKVQALMAFIWHLLSPRRQQQFTDALLTREAA